MATALHHVSSPSPLIAGTRFFGEVTERASWCGTVLSRLSHANPRTVPLHEHEHSYFSLLLTGDYVEGNEVIAPMTVSFLNMGARHDGRVGPRGAQFFTVEIDESWLDELPPERPSVLQERGAMLWAAVRLLSAYNEGGTADPLSLQEMLVELATCAAREKSRRERGTPPWIRRVADLLADRYREPLALSELASEAQVHPVHLGRTFRKVTGCTMGQRLHQLRVARACQLLSDRDRSLADVAAATGFADQPHFSRVFRRLTGTTPGRFRSQLLRDRC